MYLFLFHLKGLASAEEEVHSLKAALTEAEGQRDNYKSLLAKTNSEVTSAEAYAQLSMATGQTAASSKPSSAAAVDDAAVMPPPLKRPREAGKGKAPARQPQGFSKQGGGASTRGPDALGSGLSSRARLARNNGSGSGSNLGGGVGSASELRKEAKRKGRAEPSLVRKPATAAATGTLGFRSYQESRAAKSSNGNASRGTPPPAVGAAAAASSNARGSASTSRKKRREAETVDVASSSSSSDDNPADENLGRGRFDQNIADPRSLHDEGQASNVLGRKERGTEVKVAGEGGSDGWVAPWQDGSEAGSGGGGGSVYDSDDAPSMFF